MASSDIQIEENSNVACPFPGSDVVFSVPPQYSDLTYKLAGDDRPNPRDISNILLQGPSGLPSYTNKTVLFVFFGKYQIHLPPNQREKIRKIEERIVVGSVTGCHDKFVVIFFCCVLTGFQQKCSDINSNIKIKTYIVYFEHNK